MIYSLCWPALLRRAVFPLPIPPGRRHIGPSPRGIHVVEALDYRWEMVYPGAYVGTSSSKALVVKPCEFIPPLAREQPEPMASMGPPPFDDGNITCPQPRTSTSSSFNGATAFRRWKRQANQYGEGADEASMGPPPFDDGNRVVGQPLLRGREPSMGPPPFDDGNRNGRNITALQPDASMGPPPFDDGNCRTPRTSFQRREASMGPPPFGDGNLLVAPYQLPCLLASMGPPPFGDGNSTIMVCDARDGNASMGPPPFGDGNLRRFRLVEPVVLASMGPPPFGDGNRGLVAVFEDDDWVLQWGHRLSVMETALI